MGTKNRVIFHIDCNNFYASVEEKFCPMLKTKPMAVAGNPNFRKGIILAKNELAKKFNVKTAETISEAKRKCPNLHLVPPRYDVYREYSKKINSIYAEYTRKLEKFGLDESYLDVTETLKNKNLMPLQLANEIRERIKRDIGITVSVGISYNKVFAKFASDYRKPDAVTIITPKNYRKIVWPSPVENLLYVGRVTEKRLKNMGINTIGELANCSYGFIVCTFGKLGSKIYSYANGIDDEEVSDISHVKIPKSISKGHTFPKDLTDLQKLEFEIYGCADVVSKQLSEHSMKCTTVQITIKDPNFHVIQRQKSFNFPIVDSRDIAKMATFLLKKYWQIGKPIRMLTVSISNFVCGECKCEQLSFFC